MTRSLTSLALLALLSVAACHTEEPQSPSVGLTSAAVPPQPPDLGRGAPRVEQRSLFNLYWGDAIRDVCAGPDPFFAYDSSLPDDSDQATMQNLVRCMTSGPLQGKTIALVGRTDPRGSEEYNVRLGLERAMRVKAYLVHHGVPAERIQTASVGKEQAQPEPAKWAADRRVEVMLASP